MPVNSMFESDPSLPVPPARAARASAVACRIVLRITAEMGALASHRVLLRRDGRRMLCHMRQIAMYLCHVVLQMSQTEIGRAFRRDRTTVAHACHVVEDRRDEAAYDDFVSALERTVAAVFLFGERSGSDAA